MSSSIASADNNLTESTFSLSNDPYLQFQPSFSRSLPIQLLISGIVLTLCATLAIQLLFTRQYHWPLARANWMLQFTGVCTLLVNVISFLYVVLSALGEKSRQWPYMFEYIAVQVPRIDAWSLKETAVWCVMEAATSALASITHIQFLTYLYPSKLEARLVFLLLGPLAVLASIMTLVPISYASEAQSLFQQSSISDQINSTRDNTDSSFVLGDAETAKHQQILDLVDATRNICNLTLSLLFTVSLLIWGFFVNRRNAWRTDGGTAAFGVGALFLALVSTGLNFLTVFSHPRVTWLSSLLWAVVLWQSFLGWWWWVGSASGNGMREFDMEKRGQTEQKRTKRKRRKLSEVPGAENDTTAVAVGQLERWRSSVGGTFSRRRPVKTVDENEIELTNADTFLNPASQPHGSPCIPSPVSEDSWYSYVFDSVRSAWRSLRQAHARAARVQAIEQQQIQMQMKRESARSLGRFPGSMSGEDERQSRSVLGASDGDGGCEDRAEKRPPKLGRKVSRSTVGLWRQMRDWRLRDSTAY